MQLAGKIYFTHSYFIFFFFFLFPVPSLDKSLQPVSGPVLGPLWVSKGEGFSPKGAHSFLTTMIQNTKDRIKTTNVYLTKVKYVLFSKVIIISNL